MARTHDHVPEATLRLLLADGLGPVLLSRLRDRFGDDEQIVRLPARHLAEVEGISMRRARDIRDRIAGADPAAERSAMAAHGVRLILADDADYPPLLAAIPDPPPALWVAGQLEESDQAAVAIVGSRRCTPYGREQATLLAQRLAASGLTIVSGGALGIDAAAHRGALRAGGRTVAVLGCGLGRCYPAQHAGLFREMLESGAALLSEHPVDVPPLGHHFPRRNRIISGLSLGVLVIEAARRSGALITARQAAEDHGREVMALPGRVDSPAALGGLRAIRDGWAGLVLDHDDVLEQLASAGHLVRGAVELATRRANERRVAALSAEQSRMLELVRDSEQISVEQLADAEGRDIGPVLADLTVLEVHGLVVRGGCPGRFVRPVRG